MANKGLIGVQMSTIAPAKMPHFDAYESMGKLADIGYHCVEISQVPMTAENVAGFRKAIDELGLNVSSCTASTSPMLPGMPGEFLCNPDDYKKIVEDCRKLDCDMLRIGMLPMTCMGNYQKAVDFAKEANEYALKLKEDGIDLYYHNHHVEFVRYDGEFLLDTIKAAKDQFTADELKLLQEKAETIRDIENKLTMIEEKYPDAVQQSVDDAMSVPAGSDMTAPPDDGSVQKFPAFEGKDLDGNPVKSDELFSGNAVTVVNFWFTTCNPCVGELAELDALNKELAEKGGSLIGVNTFTLDGDETAISEAKDVLAKKGATYQNVYFDSDGEAGKFTTNIFAYPTTYVVDRSGNIVGEPIVGAITEKKQAETLQKLIEQALAADVG